MYISNVKCLPGLTQSAVEPGRGGVPQRRGARRQRLAGDVGGARAAGVRPRRAAAGGGGRGHGGRRAGRLPRRPLPEGHRT